MYPRRETSDAQAFLSLHRYQLFWATFSGIFLGLIQAKFCSLAIIKSIVFESSLYLERLLPCCLHASLGSQLINLKSKLVAYCKEKEPHDICDSAQRLVCLSFAEACF
jgi:hypothetical protein